MKFILNKKTLIVFLVLVIVFLKPIHIAFCLEKTFGNKPFIYSRFSENNNIVYIKTIFLLLLILLLFRKNNTRYFKLKPTNFIILLFRRVHKYWKSISQFEKTCFLLLFFIVTALRVYWMFNIPVTHDEASTYVNFAGKGLLYSLGYYTAPNNHILNSGLAFFTCKLPIDKLIALRIPAVLAGLTSVVALWFFLRNYTPYKLLSLVVCGMFCTMPFLTDYGVMSRGYSFVLLFYIVSLYSMIEWTKNNTGLSSIVSRQIFIFSSVLGFYSIPTFLYAYTSLCIAFIYLNKRKHESLNEFFKVNIKVVVFAMILYLPVVLFSGLDSIISNPYVKRVSCVYVIQNLYNHFNQTFSALFVSVNHLIFIILIITSIVMFIKRDNVVLFSVIGLFSAPFLIAIQGVIPFERTWIYLYLPILVIILYFVFIFVRYFKIPLLLNKKIYFIIYLFLIITSTFITNRTIASRKLNNEVPWEIKNIVKNDIVDKDVVSLDYISHTILEFYHLQNSNFRLTLYRPETFNQKSDSHYLASKNTLWLVSKDINDKFFNTKKNVVKKSRAGNNYILYNNLQ